MLWVSQGLRDEEGIPNAFVGLDEFSEDIVVALLEKGEVQNDVSLVGAFVVVLQEVKLII